ncbi:MAG TPA: CHASE3 domain-containing protein, partial [Gemmatimonadales bacterium]|nr:CHASE3 domain-containing protein [Gemmatimonadales bacterium]
MTRSWTFGQKIAAGFAAIVGLAMLVAGIAIYSLETVVASKNHVIEVNAQNLVETQRLRAAVERKGGSARGYLLTREMAMLEQMKSARAEFAATVTSLKAKTYTDEGKRLLDQIERAEAEHQAVFDRVISLRSSGATAETVSPVFDRDILPKREALDQGVLVFTALEQRLLDQGQAAATRTASSAMTAVQVVSVMVLLLAAVLALLLTRTLSRQIGAAVQHVQSSSSELQA